MGMKFGYENMTDEHLDHLKEMVRMGRDSDDIREVTDEEIQMQAAKSRSGVLEAKLWKVEVVALLKSLTALYEAGVDEPGRNLADEGYCAFRIRQLIDELDQFAVQAADVEAEKAARLARKKNRGKRDQKPKLRVVAGKDPDPNRAA